MCLICLELDKLTMTSREARRALGEMKVKLDPDHVEEVEAKIRAVEAVEPDAEEPATKP